MVRSVRPGRRPATAGRARRRPAAGLPRLWHGAVPEPPLQAAGRAWRRPV